MRRVLALCVEADEKAAATYRSLAAACAVPDLAQTFLDMADEEDEHAEWWREIDRSWAGGLLPDLWADTEAVREGLVAVLESMRNAVPPHGGGIGASEALHVATSIEFFMLDPLFTELLEMSEPGTARKRIEDYGSHIDRLIRAVETHVTPAGECAFLSLVLRRSWDETRRLSHYATRDPLTGLGNRRAFAAQLRQWISWSCRHGHPLAVMLLDLDGFQDVNDMYGQSVGDELLERVAQAIREVTRASDIAARYGGDEFAILAPETGPEEARVLAQRLLDSVGAVELRIADGSLVRPTASLGSAIILDGPDASPRDPDELLAAADQALYTAKRAGRNRAADPTVLIAPFR